MPINLDKSEIFKGLTNKQYENVLKKGKEFHLHPKAELFHQGDLAKMCFLVHQGCLKMTKLNEQGKEVIFRYIKSGELIAATALLRDRTYLVSAECVEYTEMIGWDKQAMLQIMNQYPVVSINMLGVVLDRIEEVQQRYLDLCTENVDKRIARSLLRIMRLAGVKKADGIHIGIPLSRQNLADYSGTTIYTVSRTLSGWEKKGWITSGREKIIINDPHALVLFAEAA